MDEQIVNSSGAWSAEDYWNEAESLGRALVDCLEYFEALGVDRLPAELSPPPAAFTPMARPVARAAPPAGRAGGYSGAGSARTVERVGQAGVEAGNNRGSAAPGQPEERGDPGLWASAAAGPEDLDRLIGQCRACPLGRNGLTVPVAGRGSARPLLVVVGPTPAIYEGPNGDLLTAMIEKGLKLSVDDYYLTSLVKCLPPDEQADLARADAICRPFLMRQLTMLAPKIVLALGKKPGQQLSGLEGEPLGLLRPRSHKVAGMEGVWLRITYGLEDIQSSLKIKETAWQDLLRMRPGLHKLKTA